MIGIKLMNNVLEAIGDIFKSEEQHAPVYTVPLLSRLKGNVDLQLSVFALGSYIAKVDHDFSKDELKLIEDILGKENISWENPKLQFEFKRLIGEELPFYVVKDDYLEKLDKPTLEELDELVRKIIMADGVYEENEKYFYEYEWMPYLQQKGIITKKF